MDKQPEQMKQFEGLDQEPKPNKLPEEPKLSTKKSTIIALVISVILLLGAFIYFYATKNSDEPTQESANTEQEESVTVNLENPDVYWDDTLVAKIQAYDETNDNVSYAFTEDIITVTGNGLPSHETGDFPNENNPNTISEQDVNKSLPRRPVYTGEVTDARVFGITLGGIPFEPGTAERDQATGWSIEAFNVSMIFNPGVDINNAHVQPNGTYHYHGTPESLVTAGDNQHSNLIGFAADGFPIYARYGYTDPADSSSAIKELSPSWQLRSGSRQSGEPSGSYNGDYTNDFEYVADSGDLDECNGRFTATPEFPGGTYAYFLTSSFPFAGRCVKGQVAEGFSTAPSGGVVPTGPQGPQQGAPPRP